MKFWVGAVAGRNDTVLLNRRCCCCWWLRLYVGITAIITTITTITTTVTSVEAFVQQRPRLLWSRVRQEKVLVSLWHIIVDNNSPISLLKSTQDHVHDNINHHNEQPWTPATRANKWKNFHDDNNHDNNIPITTSTTVMLQRRFPWFLSRSVITSPLTAFVVAWMFILPTVLLIPTFPAFADDGSRWEFPSSTTLQPSIHGSNNHAVSSSVMSITNPLLSSISLSSSSSSSSLQQPKEQSQQQEAEAVIDEVWNLINKYYIDGTFNNQDWDQVKQEALAELRNLIHQGSKTGNDATTTNDSYYMKIVTNMVQSLHDKYTRILDATQYASIQKFDLIGVGVTLMPNANQDMMMMVGAPPIAGSSSDRAGLKAGDFVTAVNGVPTKGRNAFDIIDQIAETANAETVTFSIWRKRNQAPPNVPSSSTTGLSTMEDAKFASGLIDQTSDPDQTFDVTMERQGMQVIKDPIRYNLSPGKDQDTKVGYIRIVEFNALANSSLQRALLDLQRQGANAYVLDLRGNTGGAFQSAVEIAGLFLRDRVATYVVDRNQVELPFRTPKAPTDAASVMMEDDGDDPAKIPMVIWLDRMSASASEVLAGSLHDNCRAVTMGDTSFGKGLIQAVYGLQNGAGLVLTVARYVTPSGYEIQGRGIVPDIVGNKNNMPAPVFVPILNSDTSKVDFQDIAKRLDAKACQIPPEHVDGNKIKTPESSLVNSG
jgi:carboxyl-terminal processing protease